MRRKYFLIFAMFILFILLVFVVAAPNLKVSVCPINSDVNIVFYGETGFGGVGDSSRSWMIHFLDWWELQDSSINYMELDANDVESDCDLANFLNLKLYIQPGGNAYYQQRSLGSDGKNNILNYLNNNGAFFGACAGFYYAAADYYWQDEYYNWPDMLDYYPVTVEGSITDIADYDSNNPYVVTSLDTGFNAIYYGGPTIGWKDTVGPALGAIEATYTGIPGELPAILKYNKSLLTSVHLEAYEEDDITGLSTEDRIENYKYLGNLINEIAETNFYVPAYTNPPQPECSDGLDNDGDGIIDLDDVGCVDEYDDDETNCGDLVCEAEENWQNCSLDCQVPQCSDGLDNDGDNLTDYSSDPGCSDINDNDETDVVGPVIILSDSFEDGDLDGWSTYGTGTPWVASVDTANEGNWSARAKQTGAGDDSFMERDINVSGYNSVTFEYSRKLVGLDAADDFQVEYFNGVWNSVEHLGSEGENNANFISKSFVVSNTTTKIRFKCEVGAVSEKCYVDEVMIIVE